MPRRSFLQRGPTPCQPRGFNTVNVRNRVRVKRRSSCHFDKIGVVVGKSRLRLVVCFDRVGEVNPSPTRNWVYFWDVEILPDVPNIEEDDPIEDPDADDSEIVNDESTATATTVEPIDRFYVNNLLVQQHILSVAAIIAIQYRDDRQERKAALRLFNYRLAQTIESFLAHGF